LVYIRCLYSRFEGRPEIKAPAVARFKFDQVPEEIRAAVLAAPETEIDRMTDPLLGAGSPAAMLGSN
jgi:hypothetical protein